MESVNGIDKNEDVCYNGSRSHEKVMAWGYF